MTTYLGLDGIAGTLVSTPDHAALDVTGDIELVAHISHWSVTGAIQVLVAKYNRSYALTLNTDGRPRLFISSNGSTESAATADNVASSGETYQKVTWRASDGRVQFFESTDGATWTQNGANKTINIGSLFAGVTPVTLGALNGGALRFAGRIYQAWIKDGIDGTAVANPDFRALYGGPSSFVDSAGRTWTVTAPASITDLVYPDEVPGMTGRYERTDLEIGPADVSLLVNEVIVNWPGGSVVKVDDASRTRRGPLSVTIDTACKTENEAEWLAEWRLYLGSQPRTRIRSLTLNPAADGSLWDAALGLRIGDLVTVEFTPQGIGDPISLPCHIEGVEHQIADGINEWSVTFRLSPADTRPIWRWDTSTWDETTIWAF